MQPFRLSGAGSTDDFGIIRYRWLLPPKIFRFSGQAIDVGEWFYAGDVTQDDRMIGEGIGLAGVNYFFSQRIQVRRGTVFEGRIDTPVGTSRARVGLRDLVLASPSVTRFVYAMRFNTGTIEIHEKGTFLGVHGAYTQGDSYDFRIETNPGSGARYYLRPSGIGATYTLVYDSNNFTDEVFTFGADAEFGRFEFDDLRVDNVVAEGVEVTASVHEDKNVILEVTDHALLVTATNLLINCVTGAPPQAVLDGPVQGFVGLGLTFDASASTDDYEILGYAWDFGDGAGVPLGSPASHTYILGRALYGDGGRLRGTVGYRLPGG